MVLIDVIEQMELKESYTYWMLKRTSLGPENS